ncbi:hypothetical protein [Kineococcus sp. NPDC059986]|uniref:hypothetical protein n=1 Tax=Kineococcus sp. NPDC059986 TaxID=3155538 RepID=UPI00344C6980
MNDLQVTELRSEDGELELATITTTNPMAGLGGGCRLIYVSGTGWTCEIDKSATIEDHADLDLMMFKLALDWDQVDDEGHPVPEVPAGDGVGFATYVLEELAT